MFSRRACPRAVRLPPPRKSTFSPPIVRLQFPLDMANADTAATASDRLLELVGCLEREAGFAEVVESLEEGHAATLDGVWGSSCALVAAALAAHAPATLLVVCPQIDQVDELIDDLALFTRLTPERFPAAESFDRAAHDEVFGQRLQLLKLLQAPAAPKLVVTSIQSLLQPVPSRETWPADPQLRVGDTLPVGDLAKWLVENGFFNTPAVELPGEFSIRGGIVDIFAPDWDWPVRVEFFGDEIESIRRFEISSQRSLESLEAVDVTIVGAGRGRPRPPGRLPAAAKLVPAVGADGIRAAGAAIRGAWSAADGPMPPGRGDRCRCDCVSDVSCKHSAFQLSRR